MTSQARVKGVKMVRRPEFSMILGISHYQAAAVVAQVWMAELPQPTAH
jgi:hypothetical protein